MFPSPPQDETDCPMTKPKRQPVVWVVEMWNELKDLWEPTETCCLSEITAKAEAAEAGHPERFRVAKYRRVR